MEGVSVVDIEVARGPEEEAFPEGSGEVEEGFEQEELGRTAFFVWLMCTFLVPRSYAYVT